MSQTTDPQGRSAAEIEDDVERSRARVSETIEALRTSMSPGQIMDQVVDYARGSGGADFARNLGGALRDNPLPVLLIGAGIGWLALSSQRSNATTTGIRPAPGTMPLLPAPQYATSQPSRSGPGLIDRLGDALSGTRDALGQAAGAVSDSAAQLRDTVTDSAAQLRDTVSDTVSSAGRMGGRATSQVGAHASAGQDALRRHGHDARDAVAQGYAATSQATGQAAQQLRQGWDSLGAAQPLLLGALGLVAGSALAALLPRTETEDRLMGEASDQAVQQLSETVQQGYAEVKEAAGEHLAEARDAAAEVYGTAREKLDRDGLKAGVVGDALQDAASRAAELAKDAGAHLAAAAQDGIDKASNATGTSGSPSGNAGPGTDTFGTETKGATSQRSTAIPPVSTTPQPASTLPKPNLQVPPRD